MDRLNLKIRMLVAIASYGNSNDRYLAQLIQEYQSMSFEVDIVVLSNIEKEVGIGVELSVGLPDKDPWSLPYGHKKLFADRLKDYDLFLYSEDDTLVTERNIRAFLSAVSDLPGNEIPGFLRFEEGPSEINYPDIHGHFHWDTSSLKARGKYSLAFLTNEHAACYLLTRAQLKSAINSGGYLVPPHKGKYDLLCSAATDPYTQCGFQKLICISHIDDFLVHHLPNKYVGTKFGIGEAEFRRQIHVLLRIAESGSTHSSLFVTETRLNAASYSKDYYEPARKELAESIPSSVGTILSIGCGWGATEAWLKEAGYHVTALPLDLVIPGRAEAAGVELVFGDLTTAQKKLAGRQFDCLLLLNILHLVKDPGELLASFREFLSDTSLIVSITPNMARFSKSKPTKWNGHRRFAASWDTDGVHFTSPKTVDRWFAAAGAESGKVIHILPPHAERISRLTLGFADSFLSAEFISIAGLKH